MVNERLPDPSDPDAVGRAEFATARRGFDQLQVRAYLKVLARELQHLKGRESELAAEIESLRTQLDDARRSTDELDDAALTARLGEETTRVLEAARSGAAEKLQRAEETAAQTIASANAEAEAIVGGAQAKVDAEIDAARARGRELVAEARAVRERMLDDLAKRRRTMRTQVEQLRSGRDRLLATHGAVREALDEIERELERELPEAHAAAELTGRRLQHEPAGTASMIETEIDEARRAGRPLVSEDDIAERAAEEPADWVNSGGSSHTDEIPVLDHFGNEDSGAERNGTDDARSEILLSDVGSPRREHRDLPREPVPVLEAQDELETVRVVEPEPADEPAVETTDEPAVEANATGDADEVEADEAAAAEVETTDDDEEPPRIDDLFARIRESRADTVARAREVLDQPLEPSGADAAGRVATIAVTVVETETTVSAEPAGTEPAAAEADADVHPDAQLLTARDAAVVDIDAIVARKLKRLLADEQNEVQDLVRRQKGQVRRDDIVSARDHHVGRYVAAVGGELLGAVAAGASFYDPNGHAADTDLSELDEHLAHELLDPLRTLLERGVDDAGGDEDEMLDRVRSAYREVKAQRVDTAARVATLAAFNIGVLTSRPEGDLLRWAVDPITGCSPDCDDNALAGPLPAGEAFPTGAIHPPNHPGCRCLLVPVDQ
jgi:cell division septum initiation protein DivIVA